MREKQFKNVYKEADRRSKVNNSDKGLEFLRMLESRLDNIAYYAGFAPSRAAARQAIVHGHVLVNGQKLDIPSYEVNEGDSIEIKMAKLAPVEKLFPVPAWIEAKGTKAKMARLPVRDEIDEGIRENLVIEFYSR
jgi:small subunit ribosomal protein S4